MYELTTEQFSQIKTPLNKAAFDALMYRDKFICSCRICDEEFQQSKGIVLKSFKAGFTSGFCSRNCSNKFKKNQVSCRCEECDKEILVRAYSKKHNKHNFCSYGCATKYRNRNKTTGYRRSKMEIYLEEQLRKKYPLVELICNETKTLSGLELDFYFPFLKLAFELNGITHYEPIYGLDRLSRSQDSDRRKSKLCEDLGIELAVIDISMFKYFSAKSGDRILEEMTKILSPLYDFNYAPKST